MPVVVRVGDLSGGSPNIDCTLNMHLAEHLDPSNPLLVAVDDVYLDSSTVVRLLPSLRERVAQKSTAVLLTMNSAASDAELRRVLTANSDVVGYLRLRGIDDGAVAEMVAQSLGATPEVDLLTLAAEARGNPFLITELLAGLREERRLELRDGVMLLRGDSLPQRIKTIVHNQTDMLSPKTRQLLRVAAAAGESFLLHDVSTMMSETTAALLPAVDEALLSGVLVCAQERLAFQCGIVWRALVESIPQPVLLALRRNGVGQHQEPDPCEAATVDWLMPRARYGDTPAPVTVTRSVDLAPGSARAVAAVEGEGAPAADDQVRPPIALVRGTLARPVPPHATTRLRWRTLTDPERDIARLVGAGLTNRQVAKQLFLSPHTVNYHLRVIFRKLDIRSRVELARYSHDHSADDSAFAGTTEATA